ncbi:hypothetical protein EB118_02080 [bacterium]|nr:hypothetical protein [bacterium]NDC93898.1 hypothetical protein [bacterium]NDD83268.1 hypothetical protein [bacterium]NDG28876.1 hypothetical protein [bacterium]
MTRHVDIESRLEKVQELIDLTFLQKTAQDTQRVRLSCITLLSEIIDAIDITEYLFIDSKPEFSTERYLQTLFTLGTLYKTYAETDITMTLFGPRHETTFRKAMDSFRMMLRVKITDELATTQLTSIYTQLCWHYSQTDLSKTLAVLQEALFWLAEQPVIHYNIAFTYHKLNRLEQSVIHYKLAVTTAKVAGDSDTLVNAYNGLSGVYRSVKQWPEAKYYLNMAESVRPDDPDIQNQLGVVYTEFRRTDLAERAYTKAIQHYKRAKITADPETLLSDIYLNFGHMYSYNGDNEKSVECYNKSIKLRPTSRLPFQNKLMNLCYIFDTLRDPMYILKQHKLINRLFAKGRTNEMVERQRRQQLHVGVVSGDFVGHPVSYFIDAFLRYTKLRVTCYSECVLSERTLGNAKVKIIKNMTAAEVAKQIVEDKIDVLIDLSGHTAFNRLDVFALRPCQVQVTYLGYPYSTGLDEMDYRITDNVCDRPDISQKMYTERLVYTPGCFLSYTPPKEGSVNFDSSSNYIKSNKTRLTIGCFNRLNKINDRVIDTAKRVLRDIPVAHFVFKTKALINTDIRTKFLSKFGDFAHRITILECTVDHDKHIQTYNAVDLALDTFPYSGTTTSCEALYMGIPVITVYDNVTYFHAQNVTASILKHSSPFFDKFVCEGDRTVVECVSELLQEPDAFFMQLKNITRKLFLEGAVCDGARHTRGLEDLLGTLTICP